MVRENPVRCVTATFTTAKMDITNNGHNNKRTNPMTQNKALEALNRLGDSSTLPDIERNELESLIRAALKSPPECEIEEWPLSDDEKQRNPHEAINFEWHAVFESAADYKFAEFSKETWAALPIGVIESLRIYAARYAALPHCPDAYICVPREPTKEMLRWACSKFAVNNYTATGIYKAMIEIAAAEGKKP
jgi:hypothetical protein